MIWNFIGRCISMCMNFKFQSKQKQVERCAVNDMQSDHRSQTESLSSSLDLHNKNHIYISYAARSGEPMKRPIEMPRSNALAFNNLVAHEDLNPSE